MATTSFAERWAKKMQSLGFGDGAEMVEHGGKSLPQEAAPGLNFPEFATQPRLWEVFGTPDQWAQTAKDRVAGYRMIGSDGEGTPICVNEADGSVWLLGVEDSFKTRVFFNSTVAQLADCVLAYMGETDPKRFSDAVQAIDPPAAVEGAYWSIAAGWLEGA